MRAEAKQSVRWENSIVHLGRLLLIFFPLLVGCDGCRLVNEPTADQDAKAAQRPPLTSRPAQAYPIAKADAGAGPSPDGYVKPGHWTTVGFSMRSNRDDQRGTVETFAEIGQVVDTFAVETSVDLEENPNDSATTPVLRPAVLPKGQLRQLDTRLLVPHRGGKRVERIEFQGEFVSTDSANRFVLQQGNFSALPPQTYFFVVLTDRPERFTRLQTADWVSPYRNDLSFKQAQDNYRIVIPQTGGVMPLAETVLDWTATAVLWWDDIPTRALTSTQRTAIIDWLHLGGTLIVSGPAAADALNDRDFGPLLAIKANGVEELRVDNVRALLESQQVKSDDSSESILQRFNDATTRVAVAGGIDEQATPIGEGGLVFQRRVGRGRLVQSRVDLMSDWLMSWASFDSFMNAAILARPPRAFHIDTDAEAALSQANAQTPNKSRFAMTSDISVPNSDTDDTKSEQTRLPALRQAFVGDPNENVHPSINTGVRFSSRDGRLQANPIGDESFDTLSDTAKLWTHPVSGLGGWKDDSPTVAWGRETLGQQIGMTIPDSSLVFRSLLVYLIVLIPVNYIVFRLIGRLEWAWLTVVPLSILGAFWVAHSAKLDIGFARSRNELAMLELPRDYSRGHLTRVVGLYNSLASRYRVDFSDVDAAITMIEADDGKQSETNLFGIVKPKLRFGFEAGPSLENIAVSSNSYGTLHVEQMIDVAGAIRLDGDLTSDNAIVVNKSILDLRDVFVVDVAADGAVRIVSLGDIDAGRSVSMKFERENASVPDGLPMGLSDWLQRMTSPLNIELGSVRLVARVETPLPGLQITPDCKQIRGQTLVLAHLRYPPTPVATPDENLITDFHRVPAENP